jgi:serine/threonine protein kinase
VEPARAPFGRYRLLDRIGAGGMAEVFRAVLDGPQGFSRTVVLKRILPNLAHDDTFLRLFLDEARISALLHHPAIVQTFDFGALDGTYFLAMELVEGWTLSDVMLMCKQRLTAVPIADVCYAMSELAGALAYAHALADETGRPLEIVHRDVSPSNIMISRQGGVKLLDFGIARAAEHVRDERTRHGTRKGKLSYMSPEQTSASAVDRRADIFSLGIVFYEWLTMRRLFKRDNEITTVLAIRNDPIVAPSVHHTGIPPELDALVMKMLARDPRERYQSCDDVVTDLVPIVQRLRGHTQSLRAFVQKLEAPGVDAATSDSGPHPGTAIANQNFAAELCEVVSDQWVEPTRPMAQQPGGFQRGGVVAFHRPRPWWRRISADRRVVIAAGGVALALALVLASVAWVARSSPSEAAAHVGSTHHPSGAVPR